MEKLKPKSALKNSGECGERQLGGNLRYRLNCKSCSLRERMGNMIVERSPPGQSKYQTLTSETVPSKEP